MEESLWQELQRLRPIIRQRWEARLRALPPISPLAHPDSLVHLMDFTLDQFFHNLAKGGAKKRTRAKLDSNSCTDAANCTCGMNPLLIYFQTAELALMEVTLSLSAPSLRELTLSEIKRALTSIAKKEIETLCSVCQRRRHSGTAQASIEHSQA